MGGLRTRVPDPGYLLRVTPQSGEPLGLNAEGLRIIAEHLDAMASEEPALTDLRVITVGEFKKGSIDIAIKAF